MGLEFIGSSSGGGGGGAPSGAAGGDLSGTYPNPTVPGLAGKVGTSDSRLSDARTPTAHKTSHAAGGSDALVASDIGATPNPESVNAVATSGAAQTIPDVTSATISRITLTAACTLTFPAAAAGKSFTVILVQDATGSRTVTWPTVKWPSGVTPTLTTTANKIDVFSFLCADGTNWLGFPAGYNF